MFDSTTDQRPDEESAAADSDRPKSFIEIIARGSRYAGKFLVGLSPADRADVLQEATIKCWLRRHDFPATTNPEAFFVNAVRDARKKLIRESRRVTPVSDIEITADPSSGPLSEVMSRELLDKLLAAIPEADHRTVELKAEGLTRDEITKRGVSKHAVDRVSARIRHLTQFRPEESFVTPNPRSGVRSDTDEFYSADDADDTLSGIDIAIEELERPESWREVLPRRAVYEAAPVEKSKDPDIAAAIAAIDSRKPGKGK